METAAIVELVQLATTENARKLHATQVLDQLRVSPDRWSVGLRLFLETQHEMARFFGLSLVRDWMQSFLPESPQGFAAERSQIRSTMLSWLSQLLQEMSRNAGTVVPFFLISNAISVVTLSVKFDFPTQWPQAFTELLQLGYAHGVNGIDVVVKVLKELEVEVVMFSETRSKAEIALNTAVKDAMRESPVMEDIVVFLCNSAQHTLSVQRLDLCAACLSSLAELVAWINVVLVLERALPTVFQLWQCPHAAVRAACLCCFYELVKKGMDPVAKVRLLQAVNLVPALAQEPRLLALLQNRSAAQPSKRQLSTDEEREVWQAGALIDMIVLELLGCWTKFEDLLCGKNRGSGGGSGGASPMVTGDASELQQVMPTVVELLQQLMPILLQIFGHAILRVSCTALPSCSRLVALLRTQQAHAAQLPALESAAGGRLFRAEEYVYPLLSAVYAKSQFPEGFDFEAALEDELDEETEAKSEVRKLFVNCCRVRPDRCLELLVAVMQSQPVPLSKAPFPPLEAALRLVHAFSECGQNSTSPLLSEGAFPNLIRALHESDVAQHPHPQVVLVYYEIAHRYIRYLDRAAVLRLFQAMLGQHGVLSQDCFLRGRAAYFLLKVAETQEGKNANVAEAVFPALAGILTDTASTELRSGFAKRAAVTEQSELYLCETAALLAANYFATSTGGGSQRGDELLCAVIAVELEQLHRALCMLTEQPQLTEAICAVATRRVAALAGLTKGHTAKAHPTTVPSFEQATTAVAAVAQRLAFHRPLRSKVLIYLHRMVACIGPRLLAYAGSILQVLLAHADASDADEVVQVLNQLMLEYTVDCLPLVQELLGVVVEKYSTLSAALESTSAAALPSVTATEDGAIQAPHLHTERLNLHRQYLLFLQHVASYGCSAALYSSAHLPRLESILFSVVLPALDGGAVSTDPSREHSSTALKLNPNHAGSFDTQDSVPVRKGALVILTSLVGAWLLPPAACADKMPTASPPAEVAAALRTYLLDHALPRALYSISGWCTSSSSGGMNGRVQVNVRDAAAQSVLVELAVLLRSVHAVLGTNSASYFTSLLTSLGWPAHRVQAFVQLLTAATPLPAFRDAFKMFIRECAS